MQREKDGLLESVAAGSHLLIFNDFNTLEPNLLLFAASPPFGGFIFFSALD